MKELAFYMVQLVYFIAGKDNCCQRMVGEQKIDQKMTFCLGLTLKLKKIWT